MSFLSYLLSLQLGVMEVQAYPQLESRSWDLNPNPTVEVDPKSSMDTRFGNQLFELGESEGTMCEETYGFLPCSTSVGGNLFLMLVYGYLLFTAAKFISDGSELLLEVMNPGLLGGLVLPILGAFPDSILILVSGVGGSVQQAQV